MRWRDVFSLLACLFVWSVAVLAALHFAGDPGWLDHLSAESDGDGILWQVQTTFLSVGFAGLAIAAQLFADTPLAIGASRGRVLEHVRAGWSVGVGLTANAVIAVETIWFPSDLGVLGVTILWFVPSVFLLLLSYIRLMLLFGNPSRLDEVVRMSFIEALTRRMATASRKYSAAQRQLDFLVDSGSSVRALGSSAVTLRVPVPQAGLVVKAIKPQIVRRAIDSLGPRLTKDGDGAGEGGGDDFYMPPQLTLDIEPGDRTSLGETAFRIRTSQELDRGTQERLARLLQSSIEYEPPGSVTPYEETDREIATLKDAVGTSLRSGAYGTAERALELLGHIVLGVWTARPEALDAPRRSSFTRTDWVYRTVAEVEQDALLSPRACGLFINQAMARALEAPRTGSLEYVDECLRSFTRIWFEVVLGGADELDSVPSRILTCVQNLAEFSYASEEERERLQDRATWVMVELVKLALDAKNPKAACLAATELNELFQFGDSGGSGRASVRAGQLVLSGWIDYLEHKKDDRAPGEVELRALVTPKGERSEILAARALTERGIAPFGIWNRWEIRTSGSIRVQSLELSLYVDRAELAALVSSNGSLPSAADQETVSEYRRLLELLAQEGRELNASELDLQKMLTDEVGRWDAIQDERLAQESLSQTKLDAFRKSLREVLGASRGLVAAIPTAADVPASVVEAHPILGLNLRAPRHYFVDKVFNQTYADPKQLGSAIAAAFVEGEEGRIVGALQSLQTELLAPTAQTIRQRIEALGDEAGHYVLATPYGGLMDRHDWYTSEFRAALARVAHIETGALDGEAILFDLRSTVVLCRRPDGKDGLTPVEGTSIAMGVFEDVQPQGEPEVRIEAGESFVVWAGDTPRIYRFASMRAPDEGEVDTSGESSD